MQLGLRRDVRAVDTTITAIHVAEGALRAVPLVGEEGLVIESHMFKRHLVTDLAATLHS